MIVVADVADAAIMMPMIIIVVAASVLPMNMPIIITDFARSDAPSVS